MNNIKLTSLLIASFTLLPACNSSSKNKNIDAQNEAQRLRHFKEINMASVRQQPGVSGKNIRVTIMGEQVDPTHLDLIKRVNKQYNTFAQKGTILEGEGNKPFGYEHVKHGDGHGTHIAGTIAAECDNKGIQGIACDATLDVYDIGAYDNAESFQPQGWGDAHQASRFMGAFSAAVNDVTSKGNSHISTGSFNMEAPYIPYQSGGPLQGMSLTEMINTIGKIGSFQKLIDQQKIQFINAADEDYLKSLDSASDFTFLGTLVPLSSEWAELEDAVEAYQSAGGVYIITESNNIFNRTSVLNAMPSVSDKVDKDLWLSVVMVQPIKTPSDNDPSSAISDETINGAYITPINNCGALASEYCILTPSYNVLSTMTEKVREDGLDLIKIDERGYQVFSGHSMGAPMVAATLALMQENNQKNQMGYDMKGLVKILKDTAKRSFTGYDPKKHGRGILDVNAALSAM